MSDRDIIREWQGFAKRLSDKLGCLALDSVIEDAVEKLLWHPHTKMPKPEDFGELGLIQVYDTQYKFTYNMERPDSWVVPMRPEWVWRRITPPPQSAPPGPKSSRPGSPG